jgi:DNA-binding CsgD family transcriptional regulator
LILLFLLIVYNVTGGFFPDPQITWLPVHTQNIIAYGSGFLMASYFPYFFFRGLRLESLRFHAVYGVPLFLLMPYLIFFGVLYVHNRDLDYAIRWGMIVPFFYSFVILYAILKAIRQTFAEETADGFPVTRVEAVLLYSAVLPWVCMAAFAYFHITQWIEVLFTNLGFVVITVIFMSRTVKRRKMDLMRLQMMERLAPSEEVFEANLLKYNFTQREMEVIRLIRLGYSYEEIGEKLFISSGTVSRHVQNVHSKAEVKSRFALIRKLETQ